MAEQSRYEDIIGLVPAAGRANRISPLPCSKELFPVGFREKPENQSKQPKVVCHYLLEKMRLAEINKTFVILRAGKWDIPAYLNDGALVDMRLAYIVINFSSSVPFTVDQAYPFTCQSRVAFGFPDIIFESDDAYRALLARQTQTRDDIVLGLRWAHDRNGHSAL
jgi:glucose-1-phosphate thymidylyltransferase